MDIALAQEDVVKELWQAYKKIKDYKDSPAAISPHHPVVENQERRGLETIILSFIRKLQTDRNIIDDFTNRTIGEWLEEWKTMHKMLFQTILCECGNWRTNEVRFGDWGDEELYRIPDRYHVVKELSALASTMSDLISQEYNNNEERYRALAYVHYQFVRIHPFLDGNGRIARVITDQLSVFLGLPPAMGGYPRHDVKRRESYHKAIRACVDDPTCTQLSQWIGGYISEQLNTLA